MDEKYADPKLPAAMQITSLTGLLVTADNHAIFRAQFYGLLTKIMGDLENTISPLPVVHAADMFREFGSDDSKRYAFTEGLVDIIAATGAQIFRVGYVWSAKMRNTFKTEQAVLGICFGGLLRMLSEELAAHQIWPVMETDRTAMQDQTFAGSIRNVDYYTVRLDWVTMTLDNKNLGEVLFSTKNSAYGAAVDFAAYLLHLRHLRSHGLAMTPFKERLADIAAPLDASVRRNEVIEMQIA